MTNLLVDKGVKLLMGYIYGLISLILACFWGCIAFGILILMKKIEITKRIVRILIVKMYKIFNVLACAFMLFSSTIILYVSYKHIYDYTWCLVENISHSRDLAEYLSLTFILVTLYPSLILIFKIVKKKQYHDNEKDKMFQGFGTDLTNKIMHYINNVPIKGIIHIFNLILVITANVCKIMQIESSLTSTTIYLSVATFYALEKATEYFAKKYKPFWKTLDNIIFETEKIDSDIKIRIEDIKKINQLILSNYINTGKYEDNLHSHIEKF